MLSPNCSNHTFAFSLYGDKHVFFFFSLLLSKDSFYNMVFFFCEVKCLESHCGSGMETHQSRVVTRRGGASTVDKMFLLDDSVWSFPNPLRSLAPNVWMRSPPNIVQIDCAKSKLFVFISFKRKGTHEIERPTSPAARTFGLSRRRSTNSHLDETDRQHN